MEDEKSLLSELVDEVKKEATSFIKHAANGTTGLPPTLGGGAGTISSSIAKTGSSLAQAGKSLLSGTKASRASATSQVTKATARGKKGTSTGLAQKGTHTGRSKRAGGSGATNQRVQRALDDVPADQVSRCHGACGEIDAMSKALNAGEDLAGAVMTTISNRTGEVMKACSSCRAVAKSFGVKIIE